MGALTLTLTLIVCVGQRGPRADLCQYCVIGWNNLSKVLHGPAPSAARHARAALRALNRSAPRAVAGSPCTARAARALLNRRCVQHCNSEYMLSKLQWAARTVPVTQLWVVRAVSRQPATCTRRHAVTARLAEWRRARAGRAGAAVRGERRAAHASVGAGERAARAPRTRLTFARAGSRSRCRHPRRR